MNQQQHLKSHKNSLSAHDETISECLNYNKESGIFHFFILQKMRGLVLDGYTNTLKIRDAEYILSKHTIPKKLHYKFLKEMQKFKLIKIIHKQKIWLLK